MESKPPGEELEGWSTRLRGSQRVARPIALCPIHAVWSVIKTYIVPGGDVSETLTMLQAGRPKNRSSNSDRDILVFSETSRAALGPTFYPLQLVSEVPFLGVKRQWS